MKTTSKCKRSRRGPGQVRHRSKATLTASLGSRPPGSPFPARLCARVSGKHSKNGTRTRAGEGLKHYVRGRRGCRAAWGRRLQAWHVISGFFLTLRFWQIVEANSKTIGCWVRSRPLIPTSHMVSFSLSTIDYKSLTYARGFYNRFPSVHKQLFQSK